MATKTRLILTGGSEPREVELVDRVMGGATLWVRTPGKDGYVSATYRNFESRLQGLRVMRVFVDKQVKAGMRVHETEDLQYVDRRFARW